MAIEITHIRFGSTKKTEDEIIRYRWRTTGHNSRVGESDKPSLVSWVEANKDAAHVGSGADRVAVAVVRPTKGQHYLRSHSDGNWTNNLVNLPTF